MHFVPTIPWSSAGGCHPRKLQAGAQPEGAQQGPLLGQIARRPSPFRSLEVTQVPGPRGQILLEDMWLLLARSSWLWSRAGAVERPSGSCHHLKDSFSPCLPHKTHWTPLPPIPDPGCGCLPLHGRKERGHQACLASEEACLAATVSWGQGSAQKGRALCRIRSLGKGGGADWISLPSFISGEMPCASMQT